MVKRSRYYVIKGDRIYGQTFSIKRARKMVDKCELEQKGNCDVVKEMER